jgi:negative regulator of sigma E activity
MSNPFDHAPDEQLGQLLRAGLPVPAHDDFVHRTLALLAAEPRRSSWDVLGTWLRPGLVAAAILALAFSMWLRLTPVTPTEASLADAVHSAGMPNALLSTSSTASSDYLLAAAVEGR